MKTNTVIVLVLGIGVIAVVAYAMTSPVSDTMTDESIQMENEVATETSMTDENEESEIDEATMVTNEAGAGVYTTYSAETLAQLPADGKAVLFFKASWCTTCRALDANIKANLGAIPTDVTIMEVDYDTNTELRQKYGVTTQHTLVQVDASGELVAKSSGTPTLAAMVTQLQ